MSAPGQPPYLSVIVKCYNEAANIDAALGALPPVQHAEFASHARRCASCRESLDEARALLDAIDGGVKALVSTEPSPHFEAKLRARLAVEKSPRRQTQLKWIPVGALAAALIARTMRSSEKGRISKIERDSAMIFGFRKSREAITARELCPPRTHRVIAAESSPMSQEFSSWSSTAGISSKESRIKKK